MKTTTLAQAQRQLPDLVGDLKEGPVVLLRRGQPCAALVGLSECFDRKAFSLGRNKRFRRLMGDACRPSLRAFRSSSNGWAVQSQQGLSL